jgi:hypothetical protein
MTTMELTKPSDRLIFDARGGEATLDDAVVDAWEGLATSRVVACLMCGGEMVPRGLPGGELTGECSACGSSLT